MGNRAIITDEAKKIAVYLHWNGGMDSVEAFLEYCRIKQYRADDYGWARLCQVIGNFFGGGLSLGIGAYDEYGDDPGDNGVYIIKNWRIIDRINPPIREQQEYPLDKMLLDINEAQPKAEQIPTEFFTKSDWVWQSQLFVGDTVWTHDYEGHFKTKTIASFNVYGEPLDEGGCTIYGIDETYRVLKEETEE